MRNLILGLSLSVAFIVGCVAGPALMPRTTAAPTSPAAPGTPKWEYKCFEENGTADIQAKANRLGQAGFEMVAASSDNEYSNGVSYFCFKRRLP